VLFFKEREGGREGERESSILTPLPFYIPYSMRGSSSTLMTSINALFAPGRVGINYLSRLSIATGILELEFFQCME
jgi:hypothetical protein